MANVAEVVVTVNFDDGGSCSFTVSPTGQLEPVGSGADSRQTRKAAFALSRFGMKRPLSNMTAPVPNVPFWAQD